MSNQSVVVARCSTEGLADGEIRKCPGQNGHAIAIYRQNGQLFATQDRCTHAMASLSEGWLEGYEVFCPVHDARFDIRTGQALCFPATDPLVTYEVVANDNGNEIEVLERKNP